MPWRTLIVDDVEDTLELLANWLELHGFEVLQATSGPQAIDVAVEQRPDLILLDVMMPRMDGIETCRILKANPQTAHIPVILVTAKDPGDARADGLMAGAVDYITKPVNLQDLTNRVEAILTARTDSPVEAARLLEELGHTALAILGSPLVWILAQNSDNRFLVSQTIASNAGSREEAYFLLKAGGDQQEPQFLLNDTSNPLCSALSTRRTLLNIATRTLSEIPSAQSLQDALNHLHITYFTVIPLIAAGKTTGVLVLGNYQPQDMETPRAQQILASLASQAALTLDYLRLRRDFDARERERESERAFRQMILDTMSDALIVIDLDGIIQYTNRRLMLMTGYRAEYLAGRPVGELFHPDDRDEIMTGLLREKASTMKFDQRLMTRDGMVIPVLMSHSRTQPNAFNSQVIVLSDMTEQKARERALERHSRRLLALNQAAQTIASSMSLHDTLRDILNAATEVVDGRGATLFLVNRENTEELLAVAAVGYRADEIVGLRIPIGEGVAGWVAREAEAQLIADVENEPRFYPGVDQQMGMSTQSLLAVPLKHADEVIGVIEVVNKLGAASFDQDDLSLLQSMGGTAAVSIINARLFDQAQRRVAELGTLLGASEAASSTLDIDSVLEHIARSLANSLGIARCSIMSWNSDRNRLEALAEVCDATWFNRSGPLRTPGARSLLAAAMTTNSPQVAHLHDDDLAMEDRADMEANGMAVTIAIPFTLVDAADLLIALHSEEAAPAPALLQTAQTTIANWQDEFATDPTSTPALQQLTQRLSSIPDVNWITIYAAEGSALRQIREVGFAEWTRDQGPRLNIEAFPNMRAVVAERSMRMILSNPDDPSAEQEWLAQRGGSSALMVPLIVHGDAIGMVILIDAAARTFEPQEINLAQGIANVVSNALENARLYQSLQSRAMALESAYNELKEADRTKDHFIQTISHELRTPLIHVLGYAKLLNDGAFGSLNDEQKEALRSIAEKAQRVADIVGDMVSVQAQETQPIEFQAIQLSEMVEQIIKNNGDLIRRSRLRVITHLAADAAPVMGNPRMIAQAIEKMLDNALKFGREGEKIEILVRNMDGPFVQVAIRDYGIGIDPKEHEKIFQRFYQVDSAANRQFEGAGLGLSVARAIIESHGGRIGVKSQLNAGSIFYFTLPKADIIQR